MAAGYDFRWNAWNLEHATKHGCSIPEIEAVASNAGGGFPRKIGDGKYVVIGRGNGGRMVKVIFIKDNNPSNSVYVIHAMPLTLRRRRGR